MRQKIFKQFITFATFFFVGSLPVLAHEYWIEPEKYEIAVGDDLKADLRNGERYKGNRLYYLKHRFKKFEIHNESGIHTIKGSDGDQPALTFKTAEPGLHILSYQSVFDRLTMEKWEKFTSYLNNQGLDGIEERHLKRGLWKAYINEDYARTIKALVKVGHGKGADRLTGLPYEFVAQKNPFTMALATDKPNFLTVGLYLDGKPQANKQVLIFQNNGEITERNIRTDAHGFAKIPLAGGGKFMLSSVHMYEGDDDSNSKIPEWYSYWANLTFGLPGTDELLNKALTE